jgi:hypothetical protein
VPAGDRRPKVSLDADKYRPWQRARDKGIEWAPIVVGFGTGLAAVLASPSKLGNTVLLVWSTGVTAFAQWWQGRRKG